MACTGSMIRAILALAAALAGLVALIAALQLGFGIDIVSNAIGAKSGGFGRISAAAGKLSKPAIGTVVAIAPLAIIAGGGALILGSRRGMSLIGAAVGGVLVVGLAAAVIK
jgi:hypothetical protein